jgi:hypothetical protein
MKLSEMKKAEYGVRLYRMPSDGDIMREARWGDSNFADLKRGYETLWRQRRSLNKSSDPTLICIKNAVG